MKFVTHECKTKLIIFLNFIFLGLFGDRDSNPSFLTPQFSTSEETFLQDTSFYERAAFNRRPSQLQHEMTTLNALGPPSHVLKARRLSKNTIKSSASTPITPVKSLSTTTLSSTSIRDKRRPSILDNYREFSNSNNSAVSPRFMALRKLSEVTTVSTVKIKKKIEGESLFIIFYRSYFIVTTTFDILFHRTTCSTNPFNISKHRG